MGVQQGGHIACGRLLLGGLGLVQDSTGPARAFAVFVGLHEEVGDARHRDRCDGGNRRLLVEQQHLLEDHVADLGPIAEHFACRGQRHLAVGRAWQRSNVVDLVVTEPRLRRGTDVGLPDVALRLLGQAHVLAQQRMDRHGRRTMRGGVGVIARQHQRTVGPRGQRRIHEPPLGIHDREVDRSARAVQIHHEIPHATRHFLVTSHRGQRRKRDVQAPACLLDGEGQQRVRGQLPEDPIAVLQRCLQRCDEPHGVAQIVHPVRGIPLRHIAWVVQRRRVVRDGGFHRRQFFQRLLEIVQYRIDLRRVRSDIHGHLACHHVALLPRRHQFTNRFGRSADDGRLRGGDHGQGHISRSATGELRKHLGGGQFHRGHGAGTCDARHQPRAAADDAYAVFERQRSGDDGCGDLTEGMADDRTGLHPIRAHRGGQCHLHGEDGGLNPVDSCHRFGCRHRLGHRESGLASDQRLHLRHGRGEHAFGGQQAGAHGCPLRTLAGEDPDRPSIVLPDRGLIRRVAVGDLAQRGDQFVGALGEHGGPHRTVRAPAREGVRQIA